MITNNELSHISYSQSGTIITQTLRCGVLSLNELRRRDNFHEHFCWLVKSVMGHVNVLRAENDDVSRKNSIERGDDTFEK